MLMLYLSAIFIDAEVYDPLSNELLPDCLSHPHNFLVFQSPLQIC